MPASLTSLMSQPFCVIKAGWPITPSTHPWTHRYGPERFSTCVEASVDAMAINATTANNPALIAILLWYSAGLRRLRARKSATRRFLSAESLDRSPRMSELCPERFGGERRYILRGRAGSRSSHLTATFLKRAFASSCVVGAWLQDRPKL